MPARPYWQGQIRLALVSIPVQVFSATRTAKRISFNQIHKPSGKRVRYEKVVPGVGTVDADDIVKGYEVEKGKYVLITDEEIEGVRLEAKKTIDLVQFVDEDEIDPVYFEKPFYVAPDEDEVAGEAYVVLRDALRESGKIGLGQMVVRGAGHIVALKPHGKGLVIETLRYADEVQKADSFFAEVPDKKPEQELLSLASELIQRKVSPFDPKKFKDSYEEALQELIDAKLEDRPPEQIEAPEVGAKVINLMEALKKSISGDGGGKAAAGKSAAGRGGKAAAVPEAEAPAPKRRSSAKAAKETPKAADEGGGKAASKSGGKSRRAA
jgi:DNA end-binding protein Ku